MLDKCYKGQPVAYNILKNVIDKKTFAHAYLFNSGNNEIALDFAIKFAKSLICPENKLSADNCGDCAICHRIDNLNFPELKIIQPDGMWIKKEQLLVLQEEFRMKPLEGDKKIYIVSGAERLNAQAANSILKFLEEPEPNIIAILITGDLRSVSPTIISRCQLISLKGNDDIDEEKIYTDGHHNKTLFKIGKLYHKNIDDLQNFVNDAKNVAKIDALALFIKKYEALKFDVLLETKSLWNDYFPEKEDYAWALDIVALFYKDVINCIYGKQLEIFDNYVETINFVVSKNKIDNVIHKLQKVILMKEKLKYNINLNLLLDKLIIEMESGENI